MEWLMQRVDQWRGQNPSEVFAAWRQTRAARMAALFAVVLLALFLRLYMVTLESAWYDESVTLVHLDAPSLGAYLEGVIEHDPYSRMWPLYHVLQYAWCTVFGASLLAARMLSVLLGVAALVPVYALGRRIFGTTGGLLAAAGFAFSMVQVYYAQEVRFYALIVLLAAWSMAALLRALDTGEKRAWGCHFALNLVLLFTHAYVPLLFVAQGLYLLTIHGNQPRRWLGWGCVHLLLAGVGAAWLVLGGYDVPAMLNYYQDHPGGWREFANTLLVFTGGRYNNINPAPLLPHQVSFDLFIGAVFVFLLAMLVWRAFEAPQEALPRYRRAAVLLVIWWLAPLVLLFIFSQLWKPVFYYRYVLFSSLAVPLIMAGGLLALSNARVRLGLTAALGVAMLYQNFALPRPMRANYTSAAMHIERRAGADARVYPFKHLNDLPFRYAARGFPEEHVLPFEGYGELLEAVAENTGAGRQSWVLFYLWTLEKIEDFEERMKKQGFETQRLTYVGASPLTIMRVDPGSRE
jgi:4-amino-4-deoxy-L-arabinose transferase-like glycosyltransferase